MAVLATKQWTALIFDKLSIVTDQYKSAAVQFRTCSQLECTFVIDNDERNQRTLYVRNVPWSATEDSVAELFEGCSSVRLPTNEDGSVRGWVSSFLEDPFVDCFALFWIHLVNLHLSACQCWLVQCTPGTAIFKRLTAVVCVRGYCDQVHCHCLYIAWNFYVFKYNLVSIKYCDRMDQNCVKYDYLRRRRRLCF